MDNNCNPNYNEPNPGETTDQQPAYQQPIYAEPVVEEQKPSNTMAIISMICGILSVTCCCGGLIPSIVAIVLAVKDKKVRGGKMSGMAVAGLITGIIGTILGVIFLIYNIVYFILVGGFAFADLTSSSYYY